VHSYLNRCAHRGTELDWQHGHFFDMEGQWLICATHGALYNPTTGAYVGGPCRSAVLVMLPVAEADGHVCLVPKDGLNLA
jgi:nitrite reductase/ring-hydroxylating ferredoxin subunit